jgi:hypothetical protein
MGRIVECSKELLQKKKVHSRSAARCYSSCGPRPPAGATVLIVSLGLLTKPSEMVMTMVSVVLLIVAGWVINRAFGVPMPLWAGHG